mmetsp:Transcript_26083/g.55892  ORF Transcript_26083/g.55892 Transcript_26083/m.55892 type:complete len:108 (-) Transcript_26083:1789-2112(-)
MCIMYVGSVFPKNIRPTNNILLQHWALLAAREGTVQECVVLSPVRVRLKTQNVCKKILLRVSRSAIRPPAKSRMAIGKGNNLARQLELNANGCVRTAGWRIGAQDTS